MSADRTRTVLVTSSLMLFCWAAAAGAQQPSPGPLVLEPLHNGFLLAPDVKVTQVDGKTGTLAGAYGGWVKDDHLLIGGGAYWLADHKKNTTDLAYGGLVVGWFFNPNRPVSFSAKALAGVGQFSEPINLQIVVSPLPGHDLGHDGPDSPFRFRSEFLVVEPEFDVQVKFSRRVRLSAGVGYRAADEPRGLRGVARGGTGSVSVQFNFGK